MENTLIRVSILQKVIDDAKGWTRHFVSEPAGQDKKTGQV